MARGGVSIPRPVLRLCVHFRAFCVHFPESCIHFRGFCLHDHVTCRYVIVTLSYAVAFLAFLKNRWLFWLSPPNGCESLPLAASRCEWVRFVTVRTRFLPLSSAFCQVKAGFYPAVSFFRKKPWRKSLQLIATILLASAYICLQLPAIDYLYRIEKLYNYLLHFLAYRGIVYMLLVVFRCASLLLWPPPGVFGCRGCFYIFERDILPPYFLFGEKARRNLSAIYNERRAFLPLF